MSSEYILRTNILMQAEDFAEAYRRCIKEENPMENNCCVKYSVVNIPAIVNAAFACELYLKSIINKKVRTHNLLELFKLLDIDIQALIEQEVNGNLQNLNRNYSFKLYLEKASCVFEDWRYIYEEKHSDGYMGSLINEFLMFFNLFLTACSRQAHVLPSVPKLKPNLNQTNH